MTINLIDARRGLHNKCLELFADKKIAEQIYRYLCDGVEDCEEAEPKHAYAIVDEDGNMKCSNCESGNCFDNYCGHCGAKLIGERKESDIYCDRNLCAQNEYNGIGCNECQQMRKDEVKE